MKTVVILIGGLFIGLTAHAQVTFQKAFGSGDGAFNNKYEHASGLCQTSDGGYIVAGYSDGTGLGLNDVYLVKFDANGDTLWTRIYGGPADDIARSIIETADGGYVICGETESYGVLKNDVLLFKTDSLGTLLWTKTYGGVDEDFGNQVIATSDGGLMIIGRTMSYGNASGDYDVWAIKTDAIGTVSWTKTYGGTGDDKGNAIQQTSDGGYIIAGEERSTNFGMLLLKINATGDATWTKTIRDTTFTLHEAHSVKQTADGGYIISGHSFAGGMGLFDMVLVKTDGAGTLSWARSYGGTSMDKGWSVLELPGSGYIIGGSTTDIAGFTRMHVVRTDATGLLTWDKSYHADFGNEGYEIIATSDGGFAIAGDVWNTFGNELSDLFQAYDAYIVKTDALGNSFGCQTNSTGLTSMALNFWADFTTTLTVSSGNTTNTPTMQESASLTNLYDAEIRLNLDMTSVLCDTACAGGLAVDVCDSSGFYCSGVGPYTYAWDSNTGSQTGGSATGLCGGTYQVTVTDARDCSGIATGLVTSAALTQELCIITVDSTSTFNQVVWEKPITTSIDSFRIYRNIIGTYAHIGSVPYADVSEFVDSTNGINPNVTSYRYKISTIDTCGNESALSAFHETIHLTVNLGIPPAFNLIWDNYEGFNFLFYRILRDSIGLGNFGVLDSVTPSNFTYTDPNPPPGNMVYAIQVVHPTGCTADKGKNFNSSKSNTSAIQGGALNSSISSNDATPGNCDGNATVIALGGTPPYTYAWSTSPVQASSIATGLCQGTYTVTVTDNSGSIVTSSVLINESTGPVPIVDFTANKTTILPSDSIAFFDLSTNAPTSWSWIFTNGTPFTSTDQNPTGIVYTVDGCHPVTLTATNGNGPGTTTKTCYIQVGAVGLDEFDERAWHNIAPNPFKNKTVLTYESEGLEMITLRVYNLIGEEVYIYKGVSHVGENVVEWSTENAGVYILNARIGDRLITEKVIKL